jgi:hypothetical protein
MSTDSTPQKRKPTGSANSTAGGTDRQIFAGKPANDNAFRALKDRFALQGRCLYRSDPADGRVVYFVERMGLIELVIGLDEALDLILALEARC